MSKYMKSGHLDVHGLRKKMPRRNLHEFNHHGTGATTAIADSCTADLSTMLLQHVQ